MCSFRGRNSHYAPTEFVKLFGESGAINISLLAERTQKLSAHQAAMPHSNTDQSSRFFLDLDTRDSFYEHPKTCKV